MSPIFEPALFAAQRDDHDYGVQDANSTNLVPWGLAPWESLVERRPYYRFSAGLADFWVLDQRKFKTDPAAPDRPARRCSARRSATGCCGRSAPRARRSRSSARRARSPRSPPTRATGAGRRASPPSATCCSPTSASGSPGRTLFVTGDTHWTMAYDRDGLFEARPCPLGIPTPNDITLTQPNAAEDARRAPGVLYADDDRGHFALLEVGVRRRRAPRPRARARGRRDAVPHPLRAPASDPPLRGGGPLAEELLSQTRSRPSSRPSAARCGSSRSIRCAAGAT